MKKIYYHLVRRISLYYSMGKLEFCEKIYMMDKGVLKIINNITNHVSCFLTLGK